MKAGWVTKPLGEVCTLQRGFDLPTSQRVAGAFPLVTSSGQTDTHNEAKVKGPGVVTGRSGSIGNVFFVQQDFWPLNTALYVKDFHGNEPKFIWYLLQFFDLSRFTSGAGVPTLNRNDVHGEMVMVPVSTDQQKRIVAVLDEAFEALSRARANAEANLADARELFAAIHKEALSRIGVGGRQVTMAEVAEIASTLVDPKLPIFSSLPHVGAGNMPTCSDQLLDVKNAAEEGLTSGKFIFDRRMVLYSKIRPYLRKASRPDFDGLCSADVYPLLPKAGILDRDFLFYLLLGPDFTEYANMGSARAGMPKVNREHLFKYSFELPDMDRQHEIAALLDETLAEGALLEANYVAKRDSLDTLSQSLLQKAFSGEMT